MQDGQGFARPESLIAMLLRAPRRGFFVVVNQGEAAFREFLGRNRVHLQPGIHLNLPVVHQVHRVDLREFQYDTRFDATTLDGATVHVGASAFYKVLNPEDACYRVQDFQSGAETIAVSAARGVIGGMQFDMLNRSRHEINEEVTKLVGGSMSEWGMEVKRFEILEMRPNSNMVSVIEKQMTAERVRRERELETQAAIRTAEGEKLSEIHRAEGVRAGIEAESKARVNQLRELTSALGDNPELAAKLIVDLELAKAYAAVATNGGTTHYFVPRDAALPHLLPVVTGTPTK